MDTGCASEAEVRRRFKDLRAWPAGGGPPQWPARLAALEELTVQAKFSFLKQQQNAVCKYWVDSYYLPRQAWPMYRDAVDVLGRHGLMNEVGVPLGVLALQQAGCGGRACTVELIGTCFGSCCTESTDANDVYRWPCGHKFDVRNKTYTKALTKLWRAQ